MLLISGCTIRKQQFYLFRIPDVRIATTIIKHYRRRQGGGETTDTMGDKTFPAIQKNPGLYQRRRMWMGESLRGE